MTTALTAALFTACSNDDFLDNAQGNLDNSAVARPTVEKVVLDLVEGDGATTRLGYDNELGKYGWEANDTIGALLMDKLCTDKRPSDKAAWEDLTWIERYQLTDYINTDYPFIRQTDGTWTTNAKMLEGNYFFSFPYASYSGNREAVHSIAEQVQDGVGLEARKKAFAKNQFFVGYARIHAGTEGGDVMNAQLSMTPILGAVGITVKNVGNDPFTVKKIVLESTDFSTLIKINPTKAEYKGVDKSESFNLDVEDTWGEGDFFNYANYEEWHLEGNDWVINDKFKEEYTLGGALVNNTEKSANYDRDEALRAVVEPMNGDRRAELTVVNVPAIESMKSQGFIVMTNAYKYNKSGKNEIKATVYTDKGMIKDVTISNVNGEVNAGKGVSVISENPIVEISPEKTNVVTLQVDINSVQEPDKMNIYNESDLQQFIEWNEGLRRPFTATLKNDIKMTKAMTDKLTADEWANANLIIEGGQSKVVVEKDAAANILDYVLVNGEVEIHNNMIIGSKSYLKGTYEKYAEEKDLTSNKLTVVEGASLTVSSAINKNANKETEGLVVKNEGTFDVNADVAALNVENYGTMDIAAEVSIVAASKNNADATINVAAKGILKAVGKLTNAGTSVEKCAVINNDGQIYNLKNGAFGKVIVGKEASVVTNVDSNDVNGVIDITANINTNLNQKTGIIAYTLTDTETMKSINDAKITELTIDGGKVTSGTGLTAVNNNVTKIVVTEKGGSIVGTGVAADKFAKAEMEINGDMTLKNVTLGGDIAIKAGTTTIEGTVDATGKTITLGSYDKESYKAMTGTLKVTSASDKLIAGEIVKDANSKVTKEMAQVNNQGTIVVGTATNKDNVTWNGTEETPATEDYTNKTVALNVVYNNTVGTGTTSPLTDDGVYTIMNLAGWIAINDLLTEGYTDDVDKINYSYTIKDVTIESSLSLNGITDDQIAAFKAVVAGKKVTVRSELIYCDPSYQVAMGDLVLEGENIKIGSGNTNVKDVFLTVNSLDYSKVKTNLTINAGNIRINKTSEIGLSEHVTYSSVTNSGTGKLVITNRTDSNQTLEWDFANKKWKSIQ